MRRVLRIRSIPSTVRKSLSAGSAESISIRSSCKLAFSVSRLGQRQRGNELTAKTVVHVTGDALAFGHHRAFALQILGAHQVCLYLARFFGDSQFEIAIL